MSILGIIIGVLLIVFALWIVQGYVNAPFKTPLLVVIVVLALIWVASYFVPGLTALRVR